MNYNDVIDFGKYKGRVLSDIDLFDPSYVEWCVKKSIVKLNNVELSAHLNNMSRVKNKHVRNDDEQLAFCMGLEGGGQGW